MNTTEYVFLQKKVSKNEHVVFLKDENGKKIASKVFNNKRDADNQLYKLNIADYN